MVYMGVNVFFINYQLQMFIIEYAFDYLSYAFCYVSFVYDYNCFHFDIWMENYSQVMWTKDNEIS
jgi:hypothetical protein